MSKFIFPAIIITVILVVTTVGAYLVKKNRGVMVVIITLGTIAMAAYLCEIIFSEFYRR
nr:hypothetical protein [uncultured Mucilaginibacter sp.]